MSYNVGDLISIEAVWTDGDGVATDPTAVFAEYKDPGGVTVSLAYPADAALVKDSAGHYRVDIDADEAGKWQYRFYSTGNGQAASNIGEFIVFTSAFP